MDDRPGANLLPADLFALIAELFTRIEELERAAVRWGP